MHSTRKCLSFSSRQHEYYLTYYGIIIYLSGVFLVGEQWISSSMVWLPIAHQNILLHVEFAANSEIIHSFRNLNKTIWNFHSLERWVFKIIFPLRYDAYLRKRYFVCAVARMVLFQHFYSLQGLSLRCIFMLSSINLYQI